MPEQQYRFDEFELDFERYQLQRSGHPVKLENIPLQLLMLLAERRGQIVTREEIIEKLWGKNVFLDAEQGINTAIRKIRLVLRDHPEEPRYIQTVVGKGYRFVAPSASPTNGSAHFSPTPVLGGNGNGNGPGNGNRDGMAAILDEHSASVPSETSGPQSYPHATRQDRSFLRVMGVLILVVAGFVAWRFSRPTKESVSVPVEIVPLTGIHGKQNLPSFSPDGSQITFKLTSDSNKDSGLYTALVGGDKLLRLTDDPGDCCAAWSPDGQAVAFTHISEKGFDIYTVSPLGGMPHKLYAREPKMNPLLAWSPDGKLLAFSEVNAADQRVITLLALADHSTRRLTSPPAEHHDSQPAFSPDGTMVAFVRTSGPAAVDDLYLMPVEGGVPQRLTFDNRQIYGPPAWSADGKEVVFSSARAGLQSLWRLPVSGGDPRPVAEASANAYYPAISARSHRLAYKHWLRNSNVWQLNLKDSKRGQGKASMLIAAQGQSFHPQFSPDGSKIAFESNRSGYQEIWVCNRDGSNPVQMTSLRGLAGSPRWSPDGRYLAFDSRPQGRSEIFIVEVPSGIPKQITTVPGANNVDPSWSRDGQWIYFASRGGGDVFQVWKVPIQGGPAVQMTKAGGFAPLEAEDGFVYYTKGFHVPEVCKVPTRGGEEISVLNTPDAPDWANWAVVGHGMYFVSSQSSRNPTLEFLEFTTGRRSSISTLDGRVEGLAVSPDRKSILYSQLDQDIEEIVVVKNFR